MAIPNPGAVCAHLKNANRAIITARDKPPGLRERCKAPNCTLRLVEVDNDTPQVGIPDLDHFVRAAGGKDCPTCAIRCPYGNGNRKTASDVF